MEMASAKSRLAAIVQDVASEQRTELERLKQERSGLNRPDFLWHYLLQSFSTMGRSAGWHGLIGNQQNYCRLLYPVLEALSPTCREQQVVEVCRAAAIRMPDRKAAFILGCFERVQKLGGPEAAKAALLQQPGREAKIQFLEQFPGIGPKYARNIMMDVYHEDFRDSIAIDVRISAITKSLGLVFSSYKEEEAFLLEVAQQAGLNGWELDRLLYNFRPIVEARIGVNAPVLVATTPVNQPTNSATIRTVTPSGKTPWGSGVATGAGSLDLIILEIPIGREFTESELIHEVHRRGLPPRGAVREHLVNREKKGFVSKTSSGWKRVTD